MNRLSPTLSSFAIVALAMTCTLTATRAKALPPGPLAPPAPQDTATVKMDLITTGSAKLMGGYLPSRIRLSSDKPAAIKKSPQFVSPLYGAIYFAGTSRTVVLDHPPDKAQRVYVDANANGDLTDDANVTWYDVLPRMVPAGKPLPPVQSRAYMGEFKLPLESAGKTLQVTINAYSMPQPENNVALMFYPNYGLAGEVTLAGQKHRALLMDLQGRGRFNNTSPDSRMPVTALLIDADDSNSYHPGNELFDVTKPFAVNGKPWEVADLSADGSFKIIHTDKAVPTPPPAPTPPPIAVKPGEKALSFKAIKIDGKPVDFPGDYKGKLVMIDFWATWCAPCMAEVPNLVKNFNEFHPKGFEVLGVSLDHEDSADQVKTVTAEKKMTWPQVYEGKFFDSAIGRQYKIETIPAAILVDGDTGMVLAIGNDLHGEKLADTLKNALAKKAAAAK